jgi:hypothetical protein
MPGKDLPIDNASMVTDGGIGYASYASPTDDGCSLSGADQNGVLGAPYSMPAPLVPTNTETMVDDAPSLGAFLTTNLHDTNWIDPTKPHMSPESQKG